MSFRLTARKIFTALGFFLLSGTVSWAEDADKMPVEQPEKTEVISVEISDFLYDLGHTEPPDNTYPQYGKYYGRKGYHIDPRPEWIDLTSVKNIKREYVILRVGSGYEPAIVPKNEKKTEKEFFEFAHNILKNYIDIANNDHGFYDKKYMIRFYGTLVKNGILSQEALGKLAAGYFSRDMVENAYALDEAVPGILEKSDWEAWDARTYSEGYSEALCRLKAGKVSEAGDALDQMLLSGDLLHGSVQTLLHSSLGGSQYFAQIAFGYSEFIKHGGKLSKDVQVRLLTFFVLNRLGSFADMLKPIYEGFGLPMPTAEIFDRALSSEELTEVEYVKVLVSQFRAGVLTKMPIGKKTVATYRDILLRNYESVDDVEFLIKNAGEDAPIELWHNYAGMCWDWYCRKESRRDQKDTGDYFHAAVAGFKRVAVYNNNHPEKPRRLKNDLFKKMAEAAESDLDVRMADLIAAYELRGFNLRTEADIRRLDQRIESKSENSIGAYSIFPNEICWHLDGNGVRVVPLRDAIELAAYLNDPERDNNLAFAVRRHLFDKLRKGEGVTITVYADLDEIYRVYEELDFKRGACALGLVLFECGLVNSARRFFHLAGVGEAAEKKIFGAKPESYWQEMETRLIKTY